MGSLRIRQAFGTDVVSIIIRKVNLQNNPLHPPRPADSITRTTMSTQKALLLVEKQGNFEIGTRPIPKPGKDQILVKVKSAALNPADLFNKKVGFLIKDYPAVLGLDFTGDVVELGEGVTRFKPGDRVYV